MANTVQVNVDHGRDFNFLTDHMTKGDNHDISAFRFSLHLMLEQALNNLIVCLMISQKLYRSCTNQLACHSGY